MPPVDLESLVSVCGGGSCDRKIACETLADGDPPPERSDLPDNPPDFPPESFWLSKDAEIDWFDRNAFYERKDSTKGNSISTNFNHSNPNSQRFSVTLKSKASVIGLPKPQKTCFSELRRNHKPAQSARLFPKRSSSVAEGKSSRAVPVAEPSSPKVSCIGRVRSKKDRSRRCRNRQRATEPASKKEKSVRKKKNGLWKSITGIFRSSCRHPSAPEQPRDEAEWPRRESSRRRSVAFSGSIPESGAEPAAEAPGLGGVKRFASGRRSEDWGIVDPAAEGDRHAVLGRRGKGPLKGVDCRREWESAGPASV